MGLPISTGFLAAAVESFLEATEFCLDRSQGEISRCLPSGAPSINSNSRVSELTYTPSADRLPEGHTGATPPSLRSGNSLSPHRIEGPSAFSHRADERFPTSTPQDSALSDPGSSEFQLAINAGSCERVATLFARCLQHGMEPRLHNGRSPLMAAIAVDKWKIAKLLIDARASPIEVSPRGESPLSIAATKEDASCQALLTLANMLRAMVRTTRSSAICHHVQLQAFAAGCLSAAAMLLPFSCGAEHDPDSEGASALDHSDSGQPTSGTEARASTPG